MQEILAILTLPMQWLIMKKDAELPWATRIGRWAVVIGIVAAVIGGMLFGALLIAEKAKAVFGL